MSEWKQNIINDILLVNDNKITQKEFVDKHWAEFKPVYIKFHGYCDDGDLYLLVVEFWAKIFRSDVQPVFKSDNQVFAYFKTAVKNKHYDVTHKKTVQLITFTDYDELPTNADSAVEPVEDRLPDDSRPFDDMLHESMDIKNIFEEILGRLSESYHGLIAMLYRKDYSHRELRKELGVSISTVRDRINTIRNEYKKILKEREFGENIFDNSQ